MVQTPAPPAPLPDPNLIVTYGFELLTTIVVATAFVFAVRWIVVSPIGQAIGERVRRWRSGDTVADGERVERLESEVESLRGELSDFAERLDFAERVLAERRERQLGAGK